MQKAIALLLFGSFHLITAQRKQPFINIRCQIKQYDGAARGLYTIWSFGSECSVAR